jgi:hypothetical protein
LALLAFSIPTSADDDLPTVGVGNGWLLIHGGGDLTNEAKERFVALAGGPEANFVVVPTARSDTPSDDLIFAESTLSHDSSSGPGGPS